MEKYRSNNSIRYYGWICHTPWQYTLHNITISNILCYINCIPEIYIYLFYMWLLYTVIHTMIGHIEPHGNINLLLWVYILHTKTLYTAHHHLIYCTSPYSKIIHSHNHPIKSDWVQSYAVTKLQFHKVILLYCVKNTN